MSKVTDIKNFDIGRLSVPFVDHNAEMRAKLRIGMSVSFDNGNGGEVTDAVVVKINKKNVKVRTVQARRNAPAGAMWDVSPSLLTIQDEANFEPPSERDMIIGKIKVLCNKHGITAIDLKDAGII